MNLAKIRRAVNKIAPSVKVENYRGCVRLTGELDNWTDIYKCGKAAVCKGSLGVVNDIRLKGFHEEPKKPTLKDDALSGQKPDVLIVGGGIVGCAVARELSRLKLDVLLVEKSNDVACGASSRNDGCIHPGIDLHKGQQKLKYVLVGPDAHEVPSREDYSTSIKDIDNIIKKQKLAQPMLNKGDIITYFSGTRAATYEEDFVVRRGIFTKNIYEAAGIQSPGITAAPAIAVDIRNWIKEDLKAEEKTNFNPVYKHTPRPANLPDEERAKYIAKNPEYGEIICRCEEVSKGEIIDALESPLKVATIDGIKRRVRPGMGRCQGGFCSPLVAKIIAEHEGIEIEDVLKGDEGSVIVYGNTKGNAKEEN